MDVLLTHISWRFENYLSQIFYRDRWVALHIWDTAGQEDYDRLRPLSYPNTSVFLVCYSVVNPVSFDNILNKVRRAS
jgi:small GTP-binding protein